MNSYILGLISVYVKFYYQQLYFKTIPVDSGFANKQMISLKVFIVVFDKFLVPLLKKYIGGDIFENVYIRRKQMHLHWLILAYVLG